MQSEYNAGGVTSIMCVQSDGKVGIGREPLATLHLQALVPEIRFTYTGNSGYAHIKGDDTSRLLFSTGSTSGTERMRIDENGKVGIGITSVSYNLHVAGSGENTVIDCQGNSLGNTEYAAHTARGQGNGAFRYTRIGVYYNSSSTSGNPCSWIMFQTGDDVTRSVWFDDADQMRVSSTASHIGTANGTLIGTQTSDERLKSNISPCSYGLSEINQLVPIEYDLEGVHEIGFGAQTTMPIIPEAVFNTMENIDPTIEDENPIDPKLGMDYVRIIPALTKAVQELSAKVTALENA
jgi:hypothetical protein